MRKNFIIVLFALIVLSFVSCSFETSEEIASDVLVSATFLPVVNEEKKLEGGVISQDLVPKYYKFQAQPVSKSSMMKGATSKWEELKQKAGTQTQYQTTQRFSVGQWVFKIRAYNNHNALIYEGSKTVVLTSGNDNVFTVGIAEKINTEDENLLGTVNFKVNAPKLSSDTSIKTMTISVETVSEGQVVSFTDYVQPHITSQTNSFSEFSASGKLKPGLYIASVVYTDGDISMSGSVVGFRVVENSTTEISGSIEESLYASATVSAISTKTLSGSLSNPVFDETGKTFTVVFTADSGENYLTPTEYRWYCDGQKASSLSITNAQNMLTSQYVYSAAADYGYHCLTCIAIYSKDGNSSLLSLSKYADYTE